MTGMMTGMPGTAPAGLAGTVIDAGTAGRRLAIAAAETVAARMVALAAGLPPGAARDAATHAADAAAELARRLAGDDLDDGETLDRLLVRQRHVEIAVAAADAAHGRFLDTCRA